LSLPRPPPCGTLPPVIPTVDKNVAPPPSALPDADACFAENIAALAAHQPEFARVLQSSAPPANAAPTRGRDGEPTYDWTDPSGGRVWLGRATTPGLRGTALVEAFQPGDGNVLLLGLGHGIEARLLVDRLARHQAIFVVELDPGLAALALRLHDFSSPIAEGRLVFCGGPDPWSSLEAYLIRHPGYLVPDRVLCMPWFDPATVADVSRRLNDLSAAAALRRNYSSVDITPSSVGAINAIRLALVTNLTDPAALRLAENLAAAAAELGWSCVRCTPESPRWMHPAAITAGLSKFAPDLTLVLGASPATLAYSLPTARTAIVCVHGLGLTREWIDAVPRGVQVIARSPEQRGQLAAAGIDDSRLLFWPPAARSPRADVLNRAEPSSAAPILVFCDALDATPEAAGLNLDSHRRLWAAAERLLRERADTYQDDDARRICDSAAKSLGMDLKSPEVIEGLTLRIRALLGPAVVRMACLKALLKADIDFHIVGGGRFTDDALAARQIGLWPPPGRESDALLRDHHFAVSIDTGDAIPDGWLDCAAASMALLIRRTGRPTVPKSFGGIEGVWPHISAFQSRDELVRLARQLRRTEASAPVPAATAAGLIQSSHLWKHRLLSLNESNGR